MTTGNDLTLDDFLDSFIEYHMYHARPKGWRYGQTLFNCLYKMRPDLSEQIRGTDLDPFYCSSPEGCIDTLVWIGRNW